MIYFISGHRDITKEEFNKYYVPILNKEINNPETNFVVGDYWGVDEMAQDWLCNNLKDPSRVTVYHMFEKPRVLKSILFNTCGGFKSDIDRDSAMTKISDYDIAFIRSGRWSSGTAQNILRRYEVLQNKNISHTKEVINLIKSKYITEDICMSELLGTIPADGLSIEDAFEVYIKSLNWSDGDNFFKKCGTDDDIIPIE